MKKQILVVVMILLIVFSSISIESSIHKKWKENNENERISDIYNEHMQLLSSYTDRINKGEEGIKEELEEKLSLASTSLDIGSYKNALGYYYIINGDYNSHKQLIRESIDAYKSTKDGIPLMLTTTLISINNAMASNDYKAVLSYSYDVTESVDSANYNYIENDFEDNIMIVVNCNLLNIFINNNFVDNAKEYYNKIEKYEDKYSSDNKNKELITYTKLIYNDKLGNNEETLKCALEYFEIVKSRNNPQTEGARANIAYALIKNNRPDEALEHLLIAKEYYEKLGINRPIALVTDTYGDYCRAKGDYSNAFEYYIKAYDLYSTENIINIEKKGLIKKIIEVNAEGNLKNDLSYYIEKYMEVDEVVNENNSVASLFNSLEEINENIYESRLQIKESEKRILEKASNDKKKLIILLTSSIGLFIMAIIYLNKEINKTKRYEKELREIVNKDFLTNCYTRAYGIRKITKLIQENRKFTIMIIDVDNFKNINDSYGHVVGDKALELLGNELITNFSKQGYAIRYGGEEFLIIIIDKNIEESFEEVELFRSELQYKKYKDDLTLTISGGIKSWNGESIEKLISETDMLLYKAKNSGKNRICK